MTDGAEGRADALLRQSFTEAAAERRDERVAEGGSWWEPAAPEGGTPDVSIIDDLAKHLTELGINSRESFEAFIRQAQEAAAAPRPAAPPPLEEYQKWVALIRELGADPDVPESALRSAIRYIAVDQRLTKKEIARAHELAKERGWLTTDETRSPDGDGRREGYAVDGDSADSAAIGVRPQQAGVHARQVQSGAGSSPFSSLTDETSAAGSEPAESRITTEVGEPAAPPLTITQAAAGIIVQTIVDIGGDDQPVAIVPLPSAFKEGQRLRVTVESAEAVEAIQQSEPAALQEPPLRGFFYNRDWAMLQEEGHDNENEARYVELTERVYLAEDTDRVIAGLLQEREVWARRARETRTLYLAREAERDQVRDTLTAQLAALQKESESRRDTLLQVRAEQVNDWTRAENAEASLARTRDLLRVREEQFEAAEAERDDLRTRLQAYEHFVQDVRQPANGARTIENITVALAKLSDALLASRPARSPEDTTYEHEDNGSRIQSPGDK